MLESWDDFEKTLNLTEEDELAIQFEMQLMDATIEARKKANLTQKELGEKTGIKQSAIARLEKRRASPRTSTLLTLLYPLGYTLKVVPIEEVLKKDE